MSFASRNADYELWLRTQCAVAEDDLQEKHRRMRDSAFLFLRATFFRWADKIAAICPDVANAPAVPTLGDVHAENFGTWRDADGRLVWGLNDYDEAAVMPYTFDLVRLATSLRLRAIGAGQARDAVTAVLDDYSAGLADPRPALLDEDMAWMRPHVAATPEVCGKFWADVAGYPDAMPPSDAKAALLASLPTGAVLQRFARRQAGGGSLGRPRFVAIATWHEGQVVREAKALVPSAWDWVRHQVGTLPPLPDLARSPSRAPNPHGVIRDGYVLRRLAPDPRKLNLGREDAFPPPPMLHAMGADLGALHGGLGYADLIFDDLASRSEGWLRRASRVSAEWVCGEYQTWRSAT